MSNPIEDNLGCKLGPGLKEKTNCFKDKGWVFGEIGGYEIKNDVFGFGEIGTNVLSFVLGDRDCCMPVMDLHCKNSA